MSDLTLIAAHALDRAIGRGQEIPWHYSEDFAHFKRETLGHTLVMGRKTYESIGRPLPGRRTVVLTRQKDLVIAGVDIVHTVQEVLDLAAGESKVFGAGGEQVYRELLPHASHQVLTVIPIRVSDADAHYPLYDESEWLTEKDNVSEAGLRYLWLTRQPAAVTAV